MTIFHSPVRSGTYPLGFMVHHLTTNSYLSHINICKRHEKSLFCHGQKFQGTPSFRRCCSMTSCCYGETGDDGVVIPWTYGEVMFSHGFRHRAADDPRFMHYLALFTIPLIPLAFAYMPMFAARTGGGSRSRTSRNLEDNMMPLFRADAGDLIFLMWA